MKLRKAFLSLVTVSLLLTVSLSIPMSPILVSAAPPGGCQPWPECKGGGGEEPPADPAIAFIASTGPNNHIVVMNADGSNQATVLSYNYIKQITMSPDGSAVATQVSVRRGDQYFHDLWRIDISIVDGEPQGSEPIELVQDIGHCPAWSPQGDVIAFIRSPGNNNQILTVPADGGDVEAIYTAPDGYRVHYPTWNSDGSKMAFTQGSGGQGSLIILDLSDGSTTSINMPEENNGIGFLDWARTKDVLAFRYVSLSGISYVYTLDLTETSPTPQMLLEDGDPDSPSWSPDDTQLVFERTYKNARRVSIYDFSTGEIEDLAKGRFPDWTRDISS